MKQLKNRESGFTLLEVLISITIIAAMAATFLMCVRLAIASRETGTHKADLNQRLRVLSERLNSTVRSAHLIFINPESESLLPDEEEEQSSKILAFEGTPDSLKLVSFAAPLMGEPDSGSLQTIRFYLQKNEDTGKLEILLNERPFSHEQFFANESQSLNPGKTMVIAQDVGYLKFRYYHQVSEEGTPGEGSEEITVKVSGEWSDNFIAEPFDFKSDIVDNKNTDQNSESLRLPRAVEISVGLLNSTDSDEEEEPTLIELNPTLIPLKSGVVFEILAQNEESATDEE